MAFKRNSPQPVVEGGTGAQTFTSHGVLLGNTSSAITATANGTTGQVFTASTGSAPGWANPAASSISITGDSGGALTGNSFTFTGGTTGLTFAGAGSTETLGGTLAIANGGTNATSMANTDGVVYYDGTRLVTTAVGTSTYVLTSNGAGVAPTFQAASGGGVTGPGSSTDRAIATWNGTSGSALFNNSTTKIDSTGRQTNSAQPAFNVYLSANVTNVTGDGTEYRIPWDTVVVDHGSNFTTGGSAAFTAPVTGQYQFNYTVAVGNLGAGHTLGRCQLITTGGTYNTAYMDYSTTVGAGASNGQLISSGSWLVPMTSGDTAYTTVGVYNSTKTVTVVGALGNLSFSGYLVC